MSWWWLILLLLLLLVIVLIIFLYSLVYYPQQLLRPVNYLLTKNLTNSAIFSQADLLEIFPAHLELQQKWTTIRDEGQKLAQQVQANTNYLNHYHLNLGQENKQNWTTIPLRLFQQDCSVHLQQCPVLAEILAQHLEIKSCLFSIMQPGKVIQPHHGPYAGLLRYQLALDIPATTEVNNCFLYVDDQMHHWSNGQGVLFDERHLHGAVNLTEHRRMVLLIDVERPYDSKFLTWLNRLIIKSMGWLPATGRALQI